MLYAAGESKGRETSYTFKGSEAELNLSRAKLTRNNLRLMQESTIYMKYDWYPNTGLLDIFFTTAQGDPIIAIEVEVHPDLGGNAVELKNITDLGQYIKSVTFRSRVTNIAQIVMTITFNQNTYLGIMYQVLTMALASDGYKQLTISPRRGLTISLQSSDGT